MHSGARFVLVTITPDYRFTWLSAVRESFIKLEGVGGLAVYLHSEGEAPCGVTGFADSASRVFPVTSGHVSITRLRMANGNSSADCARERFAIRKCQAFSAGDPHQAR